jgi:sugar/nucleoside kinase (ribokinase family)
MDLTPSDEPGPPTSRVDIALQPIEAVGQLSVDTMVLLNSDLAIGDHTTGQFTKGPGGTAAIVSHNIAMLGGKATFVGHAGASTDDEGALDELERAGVERGHVLRGPEGLRVTILVEPDGSRTMVSNDADVDWTQVHHDFSPGGTAYFEGWPLFDAAGRTAYRSIIERAAGRSSTVVLDVCSASRAVDRDAHALLLAELPIDLVLANEHEEAAFDLLVRRPAPAIVVHRGSRSTVVSSDDRTIEIAPTFVPPIDTTGAGDTFAAGLLVALQRGLRLVEAVEAGHAAARQIVRQVGPLMRSPERATEVPQLGSDHLARASGSG